MPIFIINFVTKWIYFSYLKWSVHVSINEEYFQTFKYFLRLQKHLYEEREKGKCEIECIPPIGKFSVVIILMRSAIFLPYGDAEMNSSKEMKKSLCNFIKYLTVFLFSRLVVDSYRKAMTSTRAHILNCKVNTKLLEWECMRMASFEWFCWRNQKKLRRKGICCLDYYLYF